MKTKPAADPSAIAHYNHAQAPAFAAVCDTLRDEIDAALPAATSKIWHAIPVWFVGDVPVVGYKATAKQVTLLFWNGQGLAAPELKPAGKFKAAQIQFTDVAEIPLKNLRRWLKQAGQHLWDHPGARKASS
jgi:Domain of unknown function (DU1801)